MSADLQAWGEPDGDIPISGAAPCQGVPGGAEPAALHLRGNQRWQDLHNSGTAVAVSYLHSFRNSGSSAFLTPGFVIRDGKNPDPGSEINISDHISKGPETYIGLILLNLGDLTSWLTYDSLFPFSYKFRPCFKSCSVDFICLEESF